MQMTVYELYIDNMKKKLGIEKFMENESLNIIEASVLSGVSASLATNSLEVVVIRQQAESGETIVEIFQKEGLKIFTKGLTAKLLLSSGYSVIFFLSMNNFGKLFNTSLSEE